MKFNNKNMDDEIMIIPQLGNQSNRIKVSPRHSNEYTIYLDEDIGKVSNYRDELYTITNATELDDIVLMINTAGGSLYTATSFVEAIGATQANVTAVLMGECSSAGTVITLACHQVCVLDSSEFMIHSANFGYGGVTSNVKHMVDFTHNQVHKLIDKTYAGFLTKTEIDEVKAGKEFWFGSEEIKVRLHNRMKFVEAAAKKAEKESEQPQKPTKKSKKETSEILLG